MDEADECSRRDGRMEVFANHRENSTVIRFFLFYRRTIESFDPRSFNTRNTLQFSFSAAGTDGATRRFA